MPVLKITECQSDWNENDPYELFELAEAPQSGSGKKDFYGATIVGALLATIVSLAIVWSFYHLDKDDQVSPYAYLEVKAIDPMGRPAVGALVRTDGEPAGITDAFGEWRRFMRVPLGGRVAITMYKKSSQGVLSAVKTLQVPDHMPKTGDIEVVDRIQLTFGKSNVEKKTPVEPKTVPVAKKSADPMPENDDIFADEDLGFDAHVNVSDQATFGFGVEAQKKDFDRVWVLADTQASIVTPADETTSAYLHKDVLAAMRKRARQLDVAVDPEAPWRVTISHISVPGSRGLVLARASYHHAPNDPGENLYSFLVNYKEGAMETARAVMYRISQHTPVPVEAYEENGSWYVKAPASPLWQRKTGGRYLGRDDQVFALGANRNGRDYELLTNGQKPCMSDTCTLRAEAVPVASPRGGWQKLSLALHGLAGRDVDVYVSGIQAVSRGGGRYQYWGTSGGAANLSVTEAGRLIHRAKILATPQQPAVVALSSGQISRR